jgi:branched-chain amino acid transport system substrate-binding protein
MQYKTLGRFFPLAACAVAALVASAPPGAGSGQDRLHRPAVGRRRALRQERAVWHPDGRGRDQRQRPRGQGQEGQAGSRLAGRQVRPAEAAINARRLVQQHKTPAVFVPHSGGIFALQAFNEQEKFMVMAYSSVPRITDAGNKLTIRIPPAYTGYIEPFVKAQMKRFGKNVALVPADHDYAKAWVQAFVPAWEGAGGKVVATTRCRTPRPPTSTAACRAPSPTNPT